MLVKARSRWQWVRVCLPGASYLSASALERSSVAAAKYIVLCVVQC